MLRHVIPPAHSYAQIPNAILRHPRLSSDAKTLLTWQLSLPPGEKQCLSDTARRAGIKKCAFQKAKRQLLEEGFLHQWTTRVDGGRFVTVQLVSNTALDPGEALAVRDGDRAVHGAALPGRGADVPPGAARPTAGGPTGPPVGRPPKRNTGRKTTPPTGPGTEPAGGPPQSVSPDPDVRSGTGRDGVPQDAPADDAAPASAPHAAAEALLLSLRRIDPQLAMPVRTARSWAPLAAKWLASGLSELRIRQALTDGLADARRPLGALRWRLQHALPEVPAPVAARAPTAPAPEPRVARMRECLARHTQPRLFTPPPGSDETLCPDCRAPDEPAPPPPSAGSGFTAFVTARRGSPRRHVPLGEDGRPPFRRRPR
ncbi:hypothetical protein [Streptomyces sp. TR02-1]|uniref:hypothetical protein n=1 Tax=Streptomyces sp. TR02-1 TaxID=3385977 RepID=UPI00399FDEA2